ncbi:MAG: L-lactate dehydrogenase [Chloroflexota bacterium]|nr:L-lactate dehydrogenase [Chloroflexota bacterium]
MPSKHRKVVVVGAGAVGSTYCYALAQSGLANEIALIDKNEKLACGHVLDLVHGQPYFPSVSIYAGKPADYADAQLIVITAGTAQKPGETRLDLLQRNATIMRAIMADISAARSSAIILITTNPVDVMTYTAIQYAGKGSEKRIIGSGTVLDSSRFRYILSDHCGVDIHNVHAYILGEHGDSEFAAWSMTHIAGMPFDQYCPVCGICSDWPAEKDRIEQAVRDSAYHIIDYKGATNWAIGLAITRITRAILRDAHSVLTVSTLLNGEFGLDDVCLSVPCIVSSHGIEKVIASQLTEGETESLKNSASILKSANASIGN